MSRSPAQVRKISRQLTLAAFIAVALGLLLASALAAPPRERGDSSKQVLRDVHELDKRVTYTETKIPLGELVQKVAADTGAHLVAVPEVADEPVAVVVRDLPARELLEQLADLLDYMWSRRGKEGERHYEIWQDVASKQREEALRNALRVDVIRRFQDDLHRHVEMASWTRERLQDFVKGRPATGDGLSADERARRFFIATAMTSPISRSVTQLLGRLSPEQWATVREGKILALSTDPQPGELAIPAETERVLRGAKPTLYPPGAHMTFDDPNGPEQTRRIDQDLQAQWAAATGYRVTVQIDPYAWRDRNTLSLTAAAKPFRAGAPTHTGFFDAYAGTSVKIRTEPGGDPWSWSEEKELPQQAELAKDPVFGARQLFKPKAKPSFEPDGVHSPAMYRLRDVLPDLARTYHVQFIADAYTPARARFNALRFTEPEPLYRLLSGFAKPTHRWDHQGNLIRLRSRTWFLDRPKEIPLRFARRWKELTDQHGALPLETYLEMANSFTDLQMENLAHVGEDVELPQTVRLFEIGRSRFALRLYDALSPEQRQALSQGKSLAVAQMTTVQRQLFLASLQERGRYEPYPIGLERWSEGRLSSEAKPQTIVVERPVAAATRPGQTPPAPATRPGVGAVSSPGTKTRMRVTRLKLQCWCPPDEEDTITLTVAASE
jgi:hypothetical protein